MKLKGRIVFSIDSTYDIPKIEFDFNKVKKQDHIFFALKKVHILPQISFSRESFDGGVNNTLF